MQLSSAIVDFYLFHDGLVDMQIWALLGDLMACGPLVI